MKPLIQHRRRVDRLRADHQRASDSVNKETVEKDRLELELANVTEAQQVLQRMIQGIQQSIHKRLADAVTRCLNAVFDDPYEFVIRFDRKRGKTEARLTFVRDGREFDDPLSQVGGGVIDVAALGLRLGCIMLMRPPVRRLVLLDEPGRFVAKVYRQKVRRMIERLAEDMGMQFVIVTHIEDFRMGKVIELGG